MSLLLSFHHFSLSSETSIHHHHQHLLSLRFPNKHPFIKYPQRTLISQLRPSASNNEKPLPKSAIQRIAEKLRTLGFEEERKRDTHLPEDHNDDKIGRIFIPNSRHIPNFRVGHTLDSSWSSPQNPVPDPGSGGAIVTINGLKRVVKKERKEERERGEEDKEPSLAELTLSRSEIRRLTTIGIRMKQKMKLGKAGITEGVLNGIHERWRSCEVVKIVCEDICRLNMKRTHDLLEKKTGGIVVWRTGSKVVLYRGVNYKYPYFSLDEISGYNSSENAVEVDDGLEAGEEEMSSEMLDERFTGQSSTRIPGESSLVPGVGSPGRVRFLLPGESQLVEEADRLLDGLGPRFTDWWGYEPLPIDADLLPAVVPGYKRPFRLLPYGVKPQLTNDEMTILKRLGRPLPCHFALGRNRNLQGLAAAILKLWEKCEIAKVAVKRGVQNTNSELMAEELKRLTGGVLLSRDKEYIVFYRGKDFLPSAVSSAIEQRRRNRMHGDGQVDNGFLTKSTENIELDTEEHTAASVSETSTEQKIRIELQERKKLSIQTTISKTSRKLSTALEEKAKAEKLLSDLEQAENSQQVEVDKEGITEEERYMLRRVGLRMKPFLLLGRRGVFDGTIENMHLHWKYRELVKIICGGTDIEEINNIARILEAESGGVLVAVERARKGHAIIVYRGKNYQRPASLRPQTLLNKKEALKRSIEAQRRESLKLNVLKLAKDIDRLKLKLVEDKEALDYQAGKLVKTELEPEKSERNSIISVNKKESQEDNTPVREEKLVKFPSLYDKTDDGADKFSVGSVYPKTNSNSVRKEQANAEVSFCDDDLKENSSEMIHVAASDSRNSSCNEVMFHSISSESRPTITSVSENNIEHHIVKNEILEPSHESVNKVTISPLLQKAAESNSQAIPAKARPLTNKERLLLRKQALKTRRRPVLAVGKSNVVTGVAKAIKDHFKKYPLAIVNVKGRAKGTSVQEVVFKLEQETGGVLVSQEPSKIILYRGWGAGVETGHASNDRDHDRQADIPSLAVSPELLAAMRLECGFSSDET
ncbi:CRM-domain containing factor CFM2, chloroplastic-like [Chenopodium quinoa]|uniref:CRM-domain containing factor CFM2, chloroplastic-like n=1 Tax=Chenopodium quinoa TaxID=63459 RepID=UPI000B78FDFD|nr:CRM-domain containing factor CFM2, chloroplastic-like [Chenopodium quinoa]XP_021741746.1 CRM-domain containing factor CFM2, chloroplastic-like [Chenopodium quinoa]